MRVTVEPLKEGERHKCWEMGCPNASHPQLYRGVQYVKAPMFVVTLYVGSVGGPMVFIACEDHLTELAEEFAAAVNTATSAAFLHPPERR
jgi:hypothetical protein